MIAQPCLQIAREPDIMLIRVIERHEQIDVAHPVNRLASRSFHRGAVRLRQGYGALAPVFAFAKLKRRLERVTRLELATSTLARWCSTN